MAREAISEGQEVQPLINDALSRLEGLRGQADEARAGMPDGAGVVFDEALQELSAALEELQVTVEELTDKTQQLADSEGRYADLFQVTADGLLVTDPSGVIREANGQAARMMGVDAEQLVGKPLVLFVSGPDRHLLHSSLAMLQHGRPRARLDVLIQPRQGLPFPGALHVKAEEREGARPTLRWALRDDTERVALQERLVFHARHDSLTGLLNRSRFLEMLQLGLDSAAAASQQLAVLFIDLDRFKAVNDRLGHQAGDRVLGSVASRIRETVRDADLLGRLGGDEFAVVCPLSGDVDEAVQLARRLRDTLSEPFAVGTARATVGATIGIAVSDDASVSAEDLLRRADQAMYAGKKSSGRIQVYDLRLEDAIATQVETETGLRAALRAGRFGVAYQPQVSLVDGSLLAVEALVRWHREPDVQPVAASTFVGVAEECGVLTSIDAWVVEQACRDAVAWERLGTPAGFTVGVNVGAADLVDPGFEQSLLEILETTGLPPRSLCLEVTERSALDALGVGQNVLFRLHDRGVKIAIDDFGTGYSALSYLRQLPIDLVKIDKSFVERLPTMREDRLIVASVVGLAEVIGFDVVAEGVENLSQIEALLSYGCRQAQGYLLSIPVPADQIAIMIEKGWHADVT